MYLPIKDNKDLRTLSAFLAADRCTHVACCFIPGLPPSGRVGEGLGEMSGKFVCPPILHKSKKASRKNMSMKHKRKTRCVKVRLIDALTNSCQHSRKFATRATPPSERPNQSAMLMPSRTKAWLKVKPMSQKHTRSGSSGSWTAGACPGLTAGTTNCCPVAAFHFRISPWATWTFDGSS